MSEHQVIPIWNIIFLCILYCVLFYLGSPFVCRLCTGGHCFIFHYYIFALILYLEKEVVHNFPFLKPMKCRKHLFYVTRIVINAFSF